MKIEKSSHEYYVDTDVLIRLFTADDLKKQKAAALLFEKVENKKLIIKAPVTVIADTVYVLSSHRLYGVSRDKIRNLLASLIRLANFDVDDKEYILEALDLYAGMSIDFSDAILAVYAKHSKDKSIYSFDHDYDKISGIERLEP